MNTKQVLLRYYATVRDNIYRNPRLFALARRNAYAEIELARPGWLDNEDNLRNWIRTLDRVFDLADKRN